MSNESIIKKLEDQMESAAFSQMVDQHLDSMELTVLIAARIGGVPSDVLFIVLTVILGRILIKCPNHARAHYTELMKHIIDSAVEHSNKE
jgi:hypothetical protein